MCDVGTQTPDILTQRHGPTEVLTLNRPESLNTFTSDMLDHLGWSIRSAAADPDCRAIVVTGAGDRAFCAGVDVKAAAALDAALTGFENLHLSLSHVVRTIHSIPLPVIAAVNGDAIGGGFALAAAADFRIATSNATFSDGFVNRGISGCEMGLSYFLPKLVGASVAFDWMLTGRRVDADEACQVGLVSRVVDNGELLTAALELGEMTAANAPRANATEVMATDPPAPRLDDAAGARQPFSEKRRPDLLDPEAPRPLSRQPDS
jgi:enoyl-CoA hydratase